MLNLYRDYTSYLTDYKGREIAYQEELKADFYEKRLDKVLHSNLGKFLTPKDVSHLLYKDYLGELKSSLREMGEEMIDAISYLDMHLGDISDKLDETNHELGNLASILEWGFTSLIENQRVTNLLLEDIKDLLRIPDFEKERCHYIEKALNFESRAIIDNDYFKNAESYYLRALDLAEDDFFVLFRLGLLKLLGRNMTNLSDASLYLEKSYKYIFSEIGRPILNSQLRNNILSKDRKILNFDRNWSKVAAEIAYYNGMALYRLADYTKAKVWFEKSLNHNPDLNEAKYVWIKASLKLGDKTLFKEMDSLIENDVNYFITFKADREIQNNDIVKNALTEVFIEKKGKVLRKIDAIEKLIGQNSVLKEFVREIKVCIDRNTFFSFHDAEKLLKQKRSVPVTILKSSDPSWEELADKKIHYCIKILEGNLENLATDELAFLNAIESKKRDFPDHLRRYELKQAKEELNSKLRRIPKYLLGIAIFSLGVRGCTMHNSGDLWQGMFRPILSLFLILIGLYVIVKVYKGKPILGDFD